MYLKNTRCYLSGAIEHCENKTNWRLEPKVILHEQFGVQVFDPFEDPKQQWVPTLEKARLEQNYDELSKVARNFVRKDLCWVDRCDFLIAHIPYKVPTTGTVHEIINSNNAKKPTLLVCPQGKEFISSWYYGFIPHKFMFSSWEELYKYLNEVNVGLHKNEDKWSFVYELI